MGLDQILECYNNLNEKEVEIYWRKSNFIQNYFDKKIDGADNCKRYDVPKDWILELIELCKSVIDDPSKAEFILPTASGFFWGSTDYDDIYLDDVNYTYTRLLEVKDYVKFVYWAWW